MSHNGMVICQQYANFQLSTPRMTGKCTTKIFKWAPPQSLTMRLRLGRH